MKHAYLFGIVFLLVATTVFAADVKTKNSGVVTGSVDHYFTYDPADTGTTVVSDLIANDLVTITDASGKKVQYFFKTYVGGSWSYTINKNARASIALGESVPVDIDGDGTPELTMTFANITLAKGTFTFARPAAAQDTTPLDTQLEELANETQPNETAVIDEAVNDTQLVVMPPETNQTQDAPVNTTEETKELASSGSLGIFIMVGVVALVLAGAAAAYFALKKE